MGPIEFGLAALVAVFIGSIGRLTSARGGWIINVGLAFMGAFAGTEAARHLNLPVVYNARVQSVDFPIIYSLIGSVLFVAALGILLNPGRRT